MRASLLHQLPLVPQIHGHAHTDELAEMSRILDAHPEAAEAVFLDLLAGGTIDPDKGREGMRGEQVLRALCVKQMNGFSYEDLAFHLADSMSYRAFCRLSLDPRKLPSATTLQENIKKVRPETLESLNALLVGYANDIGIERGRKTRTDCTAIDSNIHEPTDSSLLFDCVRVLARYLERAQASVTVPFTNHTRRAKRRAVGIMNAKKKEQRVERYRDLLKVTEKTVGYAERVVEALEATYSTEALESTESSNLYTTLQHYIELTQRVLNQTRRRVLNGKSVPVADKVVSIFEPHTDIIVKDRRETLYGHKVCLTAGASGLVLDCVILDGNPGDSTLAVNMIERHIKRYGKPPRQSCFDGGFSSKENLVKIKKLGVEDVAFSKAPGIDVLDMVKSARVYRRLKHFRAGIESTISFLKRCFGWDRCTWRSLESFKSYTWGSVVAANLLTLARHALT